MNSQRNLLLLVLVGLGAVVLPTITSVNSQLFSEKEKNQIVKMHRQRLENEALKIFETQFKQKQNNEIYSQLMNYKGLYENLEIHQIKASLFHCGDNLQGQLVGFDYKRHNNQNYLLCFTNGSFVIQRFVVENRNIRLEAQNSGLHQVDGTLKQSMFYREFESDKLFVALLLKQESGHFVVKIFQIDEVKVTEKEVIDSFESSEEVVRIDVIHTGNNEVKIIALLDTANFGKSNFKFHNTEKIIKVSVENAVQLKTMRIQSQSVIIFSNTSHWVAYSYNNEEPKMLNIFVVQSRIRDMKVFNNGHRYYVGIACENQQLIYQWRDKQRFRGVAKMFFKKVYRMSSITISFAREDNFFYFDQFGSEFFTIYAYDITNSAFVKLRTFSKSEIGFQNVVFNPRYSNYFFDRNIAFELKLSGSQIFVYTYDTSISHSKATNMPKSNARNLQRYDKSIFEKKIESLKQNVNKLEKTVTISKKSVNMNISFNVEFRAKVIVNKFESNGQNLPKKMYVNKRSFDNEDLLVPLEKLQSQIDKVSIGMKSINNIIENDVVYRSKDMHIRGLKEFVSHVLVDKVNSKETFIGTYQGNHVARILSNLYRTNKNAPIYGHKTFHSKVFVKPFLNVKQINKIEPDKFMYASLDQDVYANLWYKSLKANYLLIGDQLAPNISFSNLVLINQDGSHPIEIRNRLLFDHLRVDNLTIDKIDNVSISHLPGQVFQRNSQNMQMFRIPTHISTLHTRSDISADFINGYSVAEIFGNLVSKTGITHFTKDVRFNGDVNINYLNIDGKLNGLRIPEDLLDRNSEQTIHGSKKFHQAVFNSVNAKYLNDLIIPEDIVTLTKDENITTPLIVDSLRLDKNIQIDGLIDGINLTHLDQKFIASLNNRFHNITFHKEVNVSTLVLNGLVNGFNIEEIYRNALFKNGRNLNISSPKAFTNLFKCRAIVADTINGEDLKNFMTTFNPISIPGKVVFKNSAQFNNIILKNSLDGINVNQFLNNLVTLDHNVTINGNKNFTDVIEVKDRIIVEGLINRIPTSSFMLYSKPQNITGHDSFGQVHINTLHSNGNMFLSRFANKRNFSQLTSNLIDLNKPRFLSTILHCIECRANQITTGYVNGKNFTHFYQNYLSKSQPQEIRGNKNFLAPQRFVNIQTKEGISGVNLRQIQKNAITLNGYNIIRNHVIIHGDFKMMNGKLSTKLVNSIDLVDFSRKVVYVNSSEQIRIHGNILYRNGINLNSNMWVKRLNSFAPEEIILTKNRDYKIRSNVHFLGKVIASGNLNVVGLINEMNLTELDRDILKTNDQGEIEGSVNFVQNVNVNEINVKGTVDGIKLNRESILMTDTEQRVNQLIVNGGLSFNESINVLSHINNYSKDTLNNIVLINSAENQMINATKTFVRVEANEIRQMKGDVHVEVVNGVNLRDFEKHAVYSQVNREIRVKQHFRDNLTIAHKDFQIRGLVNGIDLLRDVVRLDVRNQTITGIKTFENVVLNQDVEVHGKVNALDLRRIYENILYTKGNQKIKNRILFKAPIFLASNNTVTLINNVKPKELVTLHENQEISGRIVFDSIVADKIYPSNQVNGVNLTHLSQNAFFKDGDHEQILYGTLDIKNATFNKDVELKYSLNNVDLSVAIDKAKTKMDQTINMEQVQSKMNQFASVLTDQIKQYEQANFEIEYFTKSNITLLSDFDKKFKMERLPIQFKSNLNFLKYVNERNNSGFNSFGNQFKSYIVETVHIDQQHNSLEIFDVSSTSRITRIYQERLPSNVRTLVFMMDNTIHILYGTQYLPDKDGNSCVSQAIIPTILKKIVINYSDLSSSKHIIQTFPELNIFNLGHYYDESLYHHLVINHHSIDSSRQIKIYKRYNQCTFKLFQAIPAQNVVSLVLFQFGTTNLLERYLATLNETMLTVWKQKGMSGFDQSWPIEVSTTNDANTSNQLFPFVHESRLILHASTCPYNKFEAHLNGMFSTLSIQYDDYV